MGEVLAAAGHTLVYGGGDGGSMGAVADGALSRHGRVVGILPRFMIDLDWQHPGLDTVELVDDLAERKRRMLATSDAVIALPGGCGTLDELFEAIALKRLGRYLGAIVLLDTRGFYQPLDAFMRQVIGEHFMDPGHAAMWHLAARPEDVLPAISEAPAWSTDAGGRALVQG